MPTAPRHPLIAASWINGLGTLVSRVLGMLRDMATASLLGLAGGGVADAFVIAFRIPNLFRRLFGEGALAASYLPVLAETLESDRARAWKVASVTAAWLAMLLVGLVVLVELLCLGGLFVWADRPRVTLVLGLTATMMPYVLFICLAGHLAATLQVLGHFSVPALAPTLLNLCWLATAWWIAPRLADQASQAYAIGGAVLVSGVLQVLVQLPVLRRLGFRYDYDWPASRAALLRVARTMGPMLLGLAVIQINTLADSLIAWGLARSAGGPATIGWLGGRVAYPMKEGAAAALYYGERLYQFPLAILGVAVATAIFPLLSRHAARGDRAQLGADLTLGLRLVLFLALPAGAGLMLLAEPLARLLFEHGAFTPEDAARTGRMIAAYALGVWAYCAQPVIVRGYYAMGDFTTPVRSAAAMVALNLALNLTLVWWLAEVGLALSTSVCASIQVLWLVSAFSRRKSHLRWRPLGATAARGLTATLLMAAAGWLVLALLPAPVTLAGEVLRVAGPLVACLGVYLGVSVLSGGPELGLLLARRGPEGQ